MEAYHKDEALVGHDKNLEGGSDREISPTDDRTQSTTEIYGLEGTLFEKKCALINAEVDDMAMGKYQWYLWVLCGFGYFLDLLWAEAFGLVLSPLQQEFGFASDKTSNISVCFSAGLTAGAGFWGILADIVGRQWAFNLTVLTATIFGLALGGSNNYETFLILTAFVGFGIGGNIPLDTTLFLEFVPQNRRRLLPFLSIFQPLGVVICSALAYAYIPAYSCTPNFTSPDALPSCNNVAAGVPCCGMKNNMGWRYLLFTVGAMTLAVFVLRFFVFRFQESPKFLISRGQDAKAVQVLQNVRAFNGQKCNLTLQMFEELTSEHESLHSRAAMLGGGVLQLKSTWKEKILLELDRFKMLFQSERVENASTFNDKAFGGVARYWNNSRMARLTILVWLTYICDFFGFTLAGYYLPTVIAAKNADISVGLKESYRDYIYIYLPGIVGVLIGVLCYDIPGFGRKWTMVISSGLMGASLFIFAEINSQASNIGLSLLEYLMQSMFNAVLYGWTPEAFPAPIRGTACGFASCLGRIAGLIAPLTAAGLVPPQGSPGSSYDVLLYLAGGVTLGCVLWTALLPNKIVGSRSM
ncbi:major facilitator superfamily domain-containing protein [Neohortaea acidophila]|uniref:Major facilitator superfamily domain-containing protein n=1 Tax=Neohortaea acidophila TaxID=245834 RepID=A0A6A6PM16_9PEZI|nr:major facilitator superfamily domain-containing protein [Neohortaea acidophila]KAF2480307.1 major facilitator superfamily domain-containing protein [Neohortaea acidophila]